MLLLLLVLLLLLLLLLAAPGVAGVAWELQGAKGAKQNDCV